MYKVLNKFEVVLYVRIYYVIYKNFMALHVDAFRAGEQNLLGLVTALCEYSTGIFFFFVTVILCFGNTLTSFLGGLINRIGGRAIHQLSPDR